MDKNFFSLVAFPDTMDFSSMTLTQIKRQEMDAQVRCRIQTIATEQNIHLKG